MALRAFKHTYDLAIIGGGIVGLATARQVLLRHPKLKVCILEKECELATHQSKRNSGVVHAGIYYKKGSLKSNFCIRGSKLIKEYCLSKGLPYKECGKLIVATESEELETLHYLFENGSSNLVEGVKLITRSEVSRIQPGCDTAIEAIWSPKTAIVDWQKVALSFGDDFESLGGQTITNFAVGGLDSAEQDGTIRLNNDLKQGEIVNTKAVVNCAGLYSDYLARRTSNNEHPKVIPFKGKYYVLSPRIASKIKTNIYPVPNPDLPFLGVHITPRVDGSALVGPTSVLTTGYEKYSSDDAILMFKLYTEPFQNVCHITENASG